MAALGAPDLAWGALAGAAIGMVMGCGAGGALLLVPVMVVLFDLDIKVAGSLALMVSVPVLLAGLLLARGVDPRALRRKEQRRFACAACGAVLGVALGALLFGLLPSRALMTLLEALLVYAAILNFVIFRTPAGSAFFTRR